ncbi:MAG: hypothetical protein K2Q01_08850, partial [Rickettsiales bacterium]|nr:hypothetical protein [Rickettsiales bacterium]
QIYDALAAQTLDGPVHHVLFGHTHAPLQGFRLEGKMLGGAAKDVQFHNLGVAVVGRPSLFQPLMLEQEGGSTQRITRMGMSADKPLV